MSAETLRKAAQIVRERGWTQGQFQDEAGRVCISQALFTVSGGLLRGRAYVPSCLRAEAGTTQLAAWNDAPERTADEVIAVLEAAAARLEAQA